MTRRQRLTWRRRQASPPPATPGYGTSEHDHPADQPDSGPHDYENGDTSSWASDPYPPPYPQGMPPAMPGYGTEDGDHPAEKRGSLKQLVLQRAAKAYRIASAMLGPQASTNQIDDRALDLMDLNDFVFNATYQRVARGSKVGGDFLGCDETMSFQEDGDLDEEEDMLAQMLDDDLDEDDVLGSDDGDLDEDDLDEDDLDDDDDDVLGMMGLDEDDDDVLGFDDLDDDEDDVLGFDDLDDDEDDVLGFDDGDLDEDDLDEDDLEDDEDVLGMMGLDEDDLDDDDLEDDVLGFDDLDDEEDDVLGFDEGEGLYAGLDSEEMAMLDDLDDGDPDLDDSDIDSEMASLYSSDDPNVEEAPSTESSDTAAVFSMNGDPMGLSGTPTLSDEEDSILSEIFGGKTADDDSEDEEDDSEDEEDDSEEDDSEEDDSKDEEDDSEDYVEEEDSKESKKKARHTALKKARRTASQMPRRRKPGRGPKTLGSVSRTASNGNSEVDELSKLWTTSPNLDGIF